MRASARVIFFPANLKGRRRGKSVGVPAQAVCPHARFRSRGVSLANRYPAYLFIRLSPNIPCLGGSSGKLCYARGEMSFHGQVRRDLFCAWAEEMAPRSLRFALCRAPVSLSLTVAAPSPHFVDVSPGVLWMSSACCHEPYMASGGPSLVSTL